jgi:RimJ/RimL family protein N-acetyltransferase
MAGPSQLTTARLLLRQWRPEDREPFAALNADPTVARHLSSTLSREQSDALADRIDDHFDRHGFGLWAVEVQGGTAFAGFVGLSEVSFDVPFSDRFEIGWRLAADQWGRCYATEAATAVLRAAFDELGLPEVVSFTVPANRPSIAVMERIGLQRRPEWDFDHPRLPVTSPLRPHIVYAAAHH